MHALETAGCGVSGKERFRAYWRMMRSLLMSQRGRVMSCRMAFLGVWDRGSLSVEGGVGAELFFYFSSKAVVKSMDGSAGVKIG